MTSDTGPHIQYTVRQQVGCLFFCETLWMFTNTFDKVDWPNVYRTLNKEVPRLFQVWACKQVMNITATNKNFSWRHQDGCSDKCPCCTIYVEIVEHIILCPMFGSKVEAFRQASRALEYWLEEANTDPDLIESRGTLAMALAVQNAPPQFQALGHSQDTIRWRQFLEGMILKEIVAL
jgi:hypothetical protein